MSENKPWDGRNRRREEPQSEDSHKRHDDIHQTFLWIQMNLTAINLKLETAIEDGKVIKEVVFGKTGANGLSGTVSRHEEVIKDYSKMRGVVVVMMCLGSVFILISPFLQIAWGKFLGTPVSAQTLEVEDVRREN